MINYKNQVVLHDLNELHKSGVNWENLRGKTILVTGATGMIASYFTFMLMYLNEQEDLKMKLKLLARNIDKLNLIFGEERGSIEFIVQDVCEKIESIGSIDFIIHTAGCASPYHILHDPVGIIKANILGTQNILELARNANTQKVIFTSTREIYGKINDISVISEGDMGIIDPLDYRSCYPESKRAAETLLKSYSIQHGINFNTLRIAHVYGPGMQLENDGRVMADLINDTLNEGDIQLKSDGTAVRAFCYISDAIEAIFRIMIDGKNNEAYNIANEKEPVTVLELAHKIKEIAKVDKKVLTKNIKVPGYSNYKRISLDTSKAELLGWQPKITLLEGIRRTVTSKIEVS